MEEDIKNMSKEELLEYLEEISQQLDNIALDQIKIAIAELQYFKDQYKELEYKYDKALSDLVQAEHKNKELEEKNGTLRRANSIAEDITQVVNKAHEDFMKEFIPTSLVKEKMKELEKANKNWENMYDEDQEYIVELNNKISNLEWKNEIFVKSIKSHKETIKKLQLENIGYQLSQLPDTSEEYKMLRKQLQELLED